MFRFMADTDSVILAKSWAQYNAGTAFMLFVYGTMPEKHSACPDSYDKTLQMAKTFLQGELTQIAAQSMNASLQSIAGQISEALQALNTKIREISRTLGQGIYLGGSVLYHTPRGTVLYAWGGAYVFRWNGTVLGRLTPEPDSDGLIRDALGLNSLWVCQPSLLPDTRFVAFSGQPCDMELCQQILATEQVDPTESLFQVLHQKWVPPHAVMQIEF